MRSSSRVAFAFLLAWLGMLGCVRPGSGLKPAGMRGAPTPPLHGPPAPGIRMPGWLPRAELGWDGSVRYRLLAAPELSLDEGRLQLDRGEAPLVDGRVGIKLHVDGAGFVEHGVDDIPDRIDIRRAFLTSRGVIRLFRPIDYNVEFGVLNKGFYLDSAWLMWRDVPWVGTIRCGGLDAPIGFENRISSRDRTFLEMPAPVQAFVPATSLGLFARRNFADERVSAGLGWYTVGQRQDVGDQSHAVARVVGRTSWLVRADDAPAPAQAWPELLHVGVAGAYTFAGAADVRYQSRPESFLAPIAVDTGPIATSSAFVLGLELAGRRGPLSFQGEYLHAFAGGKNFPGMYLTAAYLLTGERRPYEREPATFGQIVPARPLNLRARTFGALEGAARWSWVDLEDGHVDGGRMHLIGAGLNWYWNALIRWQLGWEMGFVDGGPLDGRLQILQARFQLVI